MNGVETNTSGFILVLIGVAALMLPSCTPGLNAVSISPGFGWVDGCNDVVIQGHGFSSQATPTIAGKDMLTPRAGTGFDEGFKITAQIPPDNELGYAEWSVVDGKRTDSVSGSGSYYFVECAQQAWVDQVFPVEASPGVDVVLTGCGLRSGFYEVALVHESGSLEPIVVGLEPVCGTGQASFQAPLAAMGRYFIQILGDGQEVLFDGTCLDAPEEPGATTRLLKPSPRNGFPSEPGSDSSDCGGLYIELVVPS